MIDPSVGDELLLVYGETGELEADAEDLAVALALAVCRNGAELAAFLDSVQDTTLEVMGGA